MSWFGANLLPAVASTLQGWRGTVKALDPRKLARLMELAGHPDEAKYVANLPDGKEFQGLLRQAIAFSHEEDDPRYMQGENTMPDKVRDRIEGFLEKYMGVEPPAPLAEDDDEELTEVGRQKLQRGAKAKATGRERKREYKKTAGKSRLAAKKYRRSPAGKRATRRRETALGRMSAKSRAGKKGIRRVFTKREDVEGVRLIDLLREHQSE